MKNKLVLFTVIIVVVLLLGVGAWYMLTHSDSKEETEEQTADEILATIVETAPITTNLSPSGFIQLSLKIQTSSEEAKEELVKRDFQLRNITLQLISSMTADQIKSSDGMADFENNIKTEVNKIMQNGSVVQIYTTNKMIQ